MRHLLASVGLCWILFGSLLFSSMSLASLSDHSSQGPTHPNVTLFTVHNSKILCIILPLMLDASMHGTMKVQMSSSAM
jgi:hypothetical protein